MILSFILHGFGSIKESITSIKNLTKIVTPTKKVEELAKDSQKKQASIKQFKETDNVNVELFKSQLNNMKFDYTSDNTNEGILYYKVDEKTVDTRNKNIELINNFIENQKNIRNTFIKESKLLNGLHKIRLSKILTFNPGKFINHINELIGDFSETLGSYMGMGQTIFNVVKTIPKLFKESEINLNPKDILNNVFSWINDHRQKFLANIWYPMWRTLIPQSLYDKAKKYLAPYIGVAVGLSTGALTAKTLGTVSAIFAPVGLTATAISTAVATALGFLGGTATGYKKVGEVLDLFTAYGVESQPYYIEEIEEVDESTFNSITTNLSDTTSISELQSQIKDIKADTKLTKQEKENLILEKKYQINKLANYPTLSAIKSLADLQDKLFNQGKSKDINEELALALKKKNYNVVRELMTKINNAKQKNLLDNSLESLSSEFKARWVALLNDKRISSIRNKIRYVETKRSSATQLAYFVKGRADKSFVDEMFLSAGLNKMTDIYNKQDQQNIITKTLLSNHTTGRALDVTGLTKEELSLLGSVAKEYGILWGGDSKEWGNWLDYPHFEQSNRLLNTYGTKETKESIKQSITNSDYKSVDWISDRYNKLLALTDEELLNASLYTDSTNELTNTLIQSNIAKFALSNEMIRLKQQDESEYAKQIKNAINESKANKYKPINVQTHIQSIKPYIKKERKTVNQVIILPNRSKNVVVYNEPMTNKQSNTRGVQ